MVIRKYKSSDCKYLAELFYQTVHVINAKDYTKEQLDVWAPDGMDIEEWGRTLSEHYTIVAVKNDRIVGFGDIDQVGFGDIDQTGYLDRLYVHKDCQNQGIASAICHILERAVHTDQITVHASITAKPFFLSRGYKIIKEQIIIRRGVSLINYSMEKYLRDNI